MKILWSVPVLAIYAYVVTILTEAGFISYFNVPSYFVEVSIRDNTVFFYDLLKAVGEAIKMTPWYYLLVIGIVAGTFILSSLSHSIFRKVAMFVPFLLLFCFAWNAWGFGHFMAEKQTYFLTLGPDCAPIATSTSYVIPAVHDGRMILVPIDPDTHKMKGGFLVKDPVELGCTLEYKTVGTIGN